MADVLDHFRSQMHMDVFGCPGIDDDCIVNGRQFLIRETDIHYRTHDLDHSAHMPSGFGSKMGNGPVDCLFLVFRHLSCPLYFSASAPLTISLISVVMLACRTFW